MTPVTDLESKLRALLDGAAQRRTVERQERERQMEVLGPKRAHWEQVADAWMRELVLPRLEALILGLPGRGRLEHLAGTLTGAVRIAWSPEFPVGASLTISIAPTPSLDGATFRARPQLIPMLAGSPSDSSYVTTAAATDDLTGVRGFLDDAVLAFANAYLDSGEPESPHQRGSFVADPVCGMKIHTVNAAEVVEYGGRRHYFCAPCCADRFREAPDRYLLGNDSAEGRMP